MKHIKTVTHLTHSSNKLATPNDLDEHGRIEIAAALNPLIANIFALFIKTKNFHWHMSGSHYRDYHLLLDEQSDQLFAMIDVLAERIRKLGQLTIRSVSEISRLQTIQDENEPFIKPKEMILHLMEDNKYLTKQMRHVHDICAEYNDVATASLLENFIDETERRTWFLFETHMTD